MNRTISFNSGAILFLIFLILKLTNTITWSWWWITLPLWWWIPFLGILVILVVILGTIKYFTEK
jgi:uncharacterized membrane protein YdcZ (DUF606 family)